MQKMKTKKKPLTFRRLRKQNVARCVERYHALDDWSTLEWAGTICGEAGEFANMTKKRKRGKKIPLRELGKELADIVTYCDLAAASLGLDLEEFIVLKFNEVSNRKPKSNRRL
jgi:NTP pyrophosphatase (non-canonical NTP hydrolase)